MSLPWLSRRKARAVHAHKGPASAPGRVEVGGSPRREPRTNGNLFLKPRHLVFRYGLGQWDLGARSVTPSAPRISGWLGRVPIADRKSASGVKRKTFAQSEPFPFAPRAKQCARPKKARAPSPRSGGSGGEPRRSCNLIRQPWFWILPFSAIASSLGTICPAVLDARIAEHKSDVSSASRLAQRLCHVTLTSPTTLRLAESTKTMRSATRMYLRPCRRGTSAAAAGRSFSNIVRGSCS
jgi:hypothetical protein